MTNLKVKEWARQRGLDKADPYKQILKLMEETGELAGALARNRPDDVIDAIGDIQVVLIILCMQLNLDLNECLESAYNEIAHRQGALVNGVFVKKEDLK